MKAPICAIFRGDTRKQNAAAPASALPDAFKFRSSARCASMSLRVRLRVIAPTRPGRRGKWRVPVQVRPQHDLPLQPRQLPRNLLSSLSFLLTSSTER
jgi:hypothetical protein